MKNTKTKIIAIASLWFFTTTLTFAWEIQSNQSWATQEISSTWTINNTTSATGAIKTPTVEFSILSSSFTDNKNISFKLSDTIKEVWENSTISIFENTLLNSVSQSTTSSWAIDIELKENLSAWTLYNLISNDENTQINWDFTYNWDKIEVLPNAKWIKEIKLITQNKIQVTIDSTPAKIDLTVLKDVWVEKFAFKNWALNITTKNSLKNSTKYILLSTLLDNSWEEIPLTNFIYDFNSPENLVSQIESTQTWSLETLAESWAINQEPTAIEEVAMTATETPATWASTNILVLLTLLTSTLLFVKNKKTIKS